MNLAFVPVRGGSKSIPLKNIRNFCGRPLVWWVLNSLQKCADVDKIVVATDSLEIADTVRGFHFDKCEIYERDPANARDTSSTESVVLEYLAKDQPPADANFILVQATAPYSTAEDFSKALKQMSATGVDSIVTCAVEKKFIWDPAGKPINYDVYARPRRQDFDGVLVENGAFYIAKVGGILKSKNRVFGKIGIYKMTGELSSIDIDEESDWVTAEALFKRFSR